MAQTTGSGPANEFGEDAAERIRELNERIIETARKAGHSYLDVYERSLRAIADFEERVGESSQIDWITNLANVQANFLRDTATAYSETLRGLLR